jgi:hypothetical protein
MACPDRSDPDPDRTTRDPAVQRVIDQYLNRWPTNQDNNEQPNQE